MLLALISLAVSGFVSSTVLPGSSEAAFIAFLLYYHESWLIALITVAITNTAGSLTSFFIARFITRKEPSYKAANLMKKYGSPLLFFSFAPVVGDFLPLAAGWLKISIWKVILFIFLGKLSRYCFIVYIALRVSAD